MAAGLMRKPDLSHSPMVEKGAANSRKPLRASMRSSPSTSLAAVVSVRTSGMALNAFPEARNVL